MELTFTQAIAAIADDNQSGAAQIAERAADILLRRALTGEASSPQAFRRDLLVTGWALICAQTAMAPLVNLVNGILWKIDQSESPRSLHQAVAQATDEFKRQLRQHALCVAEGALGLIGERSTIVTLSYSSTVQHALIHAQRAGRRLEVICAESWPGNEGSETAQLLTSCGVHARLLSDGKAIESIARADLVLVGADMLTNDGLVNKIGTRRMALAASTAGTPFYTLCGSEKFLPPGFQPLAGIDWTPDDTLADVTRDAHIPQLVFDFTPLAALSGIVTEQGILPIAAIEAWLAATRLHPELANYVAEHKHWQ